MLIHTGTDCAHTGFGLCRNCREPMRVKYSGDNRLLAPLAMLLKDGELAPRNGQEFKITYTLLALSPRHTCSRQCSHA